MPVLSPACCIGSLTLIIQQKDLFCHRFLRILYYPDMHSFLTLNPVTRRNIPDSLFCLPKAEAPLPIGKGASV